MGRFTQISETAFKGMQMDAGVLLKKFEPKTGVFDNADIASTTSGGIKAECKPTFTDLGEDVDNCPNNVKELKILDGWECTLSFTSLEARLEGIKLALGCADIDTGNAKIVPRRDLKQSDFTDIWWVGDRTDGGMVAIRLINALSTDGFSLQTTKKGKGQITITLTGHVSITAQNVVPMEFYSAEPKA